MWFDESPNTTHYSISNWTMMICFISDFDDSWLLFRGNYSFRSGIRVKHLRGKLKEFRKPSSVTMRTHFTECLLRIQESCCPSDLGLGCIHWLGFLHLALIVHTTCPVTGDSIADILFLVTLCRSYLQPLHMSLESLTLGLDFQKGETPRYSIKSLSCSKMVISRSVITPDGVHASW